MSHTQKPAGLYDDGYCVRVKFDDDPRRYPNADHQGFPHLCKWPEGNAWRAAARWARQQGATIIIRDYGKPGSPHCKPCDCCGDGSGLDASESATSANQRRTRSEVDHDRTGVRHVRVGERPPGRLGRPGPDEGCQGRHPAREEGRQGGCKTGEEAREARSEALATQRSDPLARARTPRSEARAIPRWSSPRSASSEHAAPLAILRYGRPVLASRCPASRASISSAEHWSLRGPCPVVASSGNAA